MSQHPVLAEEINSACLADDEILHKQQGEPESRLEEISRQRYEHLSERIATYREAYNQIYIDKDNEKDNYA